MADEGKKPVENHLNVTASEAVRGLVIEKTEEDGVAKGVRRRHVLPRSSCRSPRTPVYHCEGAK